MHAPLLIFLARQIQLFDIKLREGLREDERIPSGNRIAIAPHCVTATEDSGRDAPAKGYPPFDRKAYPTPENDVGRNPKKIPINVDRSDKNTLR
ncbi:hypothetical protein [Paraburkholderia sediminicola]|uniref:hypothetical protein n=1 Tax=Paraburkholderia sediminicola TaxID=458836 RepID=UPI0038B6C053